MGYRAQANEVIYHEYYIVPQVGRQTLAALNHAVRWGAARFELRNYSKCPRYL